ncbi:nucleotide exchange factor GrpE [Plantactinospora solaniradicis]|uniref:Protein GrpE n=1 Tax=Plantactinospora solaniradicis TaxID=1723736 RepID=A0ABW1KBV2_9ACTN
MTDKPRAVDPDTVGSTPGGSAPGRAESTAGEGIVIRDKRKINMTGDKVSQGRHAQPDGAGETDAAGTPADGAPTAVKDPNPDPEPPAGAEAPTVATGEVDDTESSGAAGTVDDAKSIDGTPDVPDSAAVTDQGDVTDEPDAAADEPAPATPVVDDAELAEVLEAEKPSGTEGPVVDAPATPVGGGAPEVDGPGPLGAELAALRAELDERTRDLQRVTAEYSNYRKRVDRDRGLVAEQATGAVLVALLPVLDDLDRAREHGDLVGPFGTVAEQLNATLGKFGLTPFGEKGDPFDPNRHEAVAHRTSAEVTESTCVEVMRRGYQLGDRVLRAALVAVADPESE